jgi:uncharacterized protein (TIGR03083 family)
MEKERVFAATTLERCRIADLICQLDDAQLATPSLCTGWDVKTVAAHLLSNLSESVPGVVWLAARRRSGARAIDELARRRAHLPAADIAAGLHRLADRRYWRPPPRGHIGPLADVLVHSGDMRIPLGLSFDPDPQLAVAALDFLTGLSAFDMVTPGNLRGISLRATDVGRVWGKGAEVRGPVAALMMAAAGRGALVDALKGPGLATLRQRLSGGREQLAPREHAPLPVPKRVVLACKDSHVGAIANRWTVAVRLSVANPHHPPAPRRPLNVTTA